MHVGSRRSTAFQQFLTALLGSSSFRTTSPYGNRRDPRPPPLGTGNIVFHKGVDLGTPTGTPIRAVANGFAKGGFTAGGGGYVELTYFSPAGPKITLMMKHLSQHPSNGQLVQVTQGDLIGYTGNTGQNTTGPHLHLEVYVDDKRVDPEAWKEY